MIDVAALTAELRRQVLLMEEDLWDRVAVDRELEGRWKDEYWRAMEKERTAASWIIWRDDRVTQAAVAWVLITVFIRFCEDNALVGPVWIAGPEQRRQEALDAQLAFFCTRPEDTDREWLQAAIDYLAALPATRTLVDSHSALHYVAPSGNAATRLLHFWRTRTEEGALVHDLKDASLSTRFLGDLYEDLSLRAKHTYALLQTPVFVEEFILDRTLEPALTERPLESFRLIDPAFGAGHFLLGAFGRLLDRWHKHAPGLEVGARVQAALDAIHGVDLNPFAVAIARFRLTIAALQACGLASLEAAPAFTLNLAAGDSLIHGSTDVLPGISDDTAFTSFTYTTEDGPLLLTLLEEGRYDTVVGNPPHITVKDKALNQLYRSRYANVCRGKYSLSVPFMAKFFALAKSGEQAGWIGVITSNSFMKRDFGTKLVEDFLPHLDLRLVADTSGAYIPGHGTPTVIIVGRNHEPVGSTVRTILGARGEPTRPEDPAHGIVWTSIVEHVDDPGWVDGWITVTDLDRAVLTNHPWSLSDGRAVGQQDLLKALPGQSSQQRESSYITPSTLKDGRVPPYLGRVLDDYGEPTGTCFQVADGVLVTAWHVLDALDAGMIGAVITVDPLQGGLTRQARVERTDPLHDLAVLTTGEPLAGCVPGLAFSDEVAIAAPVIITGVPMLDDPGHSYRYLDADGHWAGGTTRDGEVPLGRVSAMAVMRGMSGAPVLAVPPVPAQQMVVGVVSARYNSAGGWGRDSVWVARTEDLTPLLNELGEVTLARPGWASAAKLTLPLIDAVPPASIGHVFISYVREDSIDVDRLQQVLLASGVRVWRDTADLWPGDNWHAKIRRAIADDALVFIACFSRKSRRRKKSYQNEELALAVEQIRLRPPEEPWLIPVRFDDCDIPELDIGGGRTLTSIQRSDLFGDRFDKEATRLAIAIQRILGR